ncbi:BQ5605_C019g08988 [Microbotryum silenes-dioicae]|uniref:BQ5605_C019g08988 protein n=1 Tax=Microbotryum silenes-dioicae TaxID=796604 RepID=A0A2X0NU43_9BASI|nr:BQ5605_C019g08988 [Microbotryum silenes-dioicae]
MLAASSSNHTNGNTPGIGSAMNHPHSLHNLPKSNPATPTFAPPTLGSSSSSTSTTATGGQQLQQRPITASAVPASASTSSTSLANSNMRNGSTAPHSATRSDSLPTMIDGYDPLTPGRNYLELIHSWDDDDIARWLNEIRVPQYEPLFRQNDIRGTVLLDVDQTALKEMGLRSVGDRVKIVVAIKNLRQRCVTQAFNERASVRAQQLQQQQHHSLPSPTRTGPIISPPNGGLLASRKVGSGRISGRIPPPLHLANSNTVPSLSNSDVPQAWQASVPNSNSASTVTLGRSSSLASKPLGALPHSLAAARAASPGQHRLGTSPPTSASSLNHLGRTPSISTTAASPSRPSSTLTGSSGGASTSNYHLRTGPPTSAGPRSAQLAQPLISPQHRKSSSTSVPPRPPPHGNSPTQEGFSIATYGRGSPAPSTTPKLLPSLVIGGAQMGTSSPTAFDNPTVSNLSQSASLTARPGSAPSIPASTSTSSLNAVMRKAVKFIGDDGVSKMIAVSDCRDGREVMTRVVKKFMPVVTAAHLGSPQLDVDELDDWEVYALAADGSSRLLNESELLRICQEANAPERQRGLGVRSVRQAELDQSARGKRGRKLRWVFGEANTPDSNRPGGVAASPTSPGHLTSEIPWTSVEPASPSSVVSPFSPEERADSHSTLPNSLSLGNNSNKRMTNRASVVSVMSGLGGADPDSPSSRDTVRTSPSASSGLLNSGRRLRSFFGQRPPSELIATHLTEYFPKAEKNKLLSKQVRQSMRKSMVRRDSAASFGHTAGGFGNGGPVPPIPGSTSWERTPNDRASLASRHSSSSGSSGANATTVEVGAGEVAASGAGSRTTSDDSARSVVSLLEPMAESAETGLSNEDEGKTAHPRPPPLDRRGSRLSVASSKLSLYERRKSRADSDAASVLTVDDVTAELETRRASMLSYAESQSDESDAGGEGSVNAGLRPPSIALSMEEEVEEEDYDEDEDDDLEEDEEEDEEADKADDVSSKPAIKWIKGALIGAGSFGSVFLGMNPMSGLLMAVKQVELPTGNSHNEERKKSMLEALEREIELLKDLRHENIVQYFDSSTDSTHLNIFLEYVPGGSVAALLSNYGAFEEALVSKFVRQILTGLAYLHDREIIHRDIKGANILVDNKGGIKISDFGISKKVEDNLLSGAKVHRPSLQGSVYWMAPEVVKQTSYTSKADIWSLGCLVVEMLTGAPPWANLTQMQAIFRIGSSVRPTIPDDISNDADDFLEQTFEIDHEARPSALELLSHGFIKDPDHTMTSQQTPTRATFSQTNHPTG